MKLQTKLIAAFTAVVLLMGFSQSLLLQSRIEDAFEGYLEKSNIGFMQNVKQSLEAYYKENGSFADVQEHLSEGSYFNGGQGQSQGRGQRRMMNGSPMMNMSISNYEVILLDENGIVIADSKGERVGESAADLAGHREELIVDGQDVGTLLFYQYRLQELEEEYLQSAKAAIFISTLLATVLAVLISIWFARRISDPLKKLMRGIKQLGRGEQAEHVHITSRDEFQELGKAFNEMSGQLVRNEEIRKSLVADVAHELRTPLTILQGKLETIQEGAVEPSEEVILELTDEVYRLNRLVKDLQQLSLAEAGKLPLQKEPVVMKSFINKVCSNLEWLAQEREITLNCDLIPENYELLIDTDRMTQVLVNLIGNALRHTPAGGRVSITAEKQGDFFLIHVADTGAGIPEDALPFIFDRFYKRDPSRTRKESGTGLGLSIAKGFVEAHGGSISVSSETNKGTIFTISLPAK